jgi:hypothetical protein
MLETPADVITMSWRKVGLQHPMLIELPVEIQVEEQ